MLCLGPQISEHPQGGALLVKGILCCQDCREQVFQMAEANSLIYREVLHIL